MGTGKPDPDPDPAPAPDSGYALAMDGRAHPYPTSLCATCVGERLVAAARSTFVRCARLPTKYPPQPVSSCDAYELRPPRPAEPDDDTR